MEYRKTINDMIIQSIDNTRGNKYIIYPFGDVGMEAKYILNHGFGIMEEFIVDNTYSKYNPNIYSSDLFKKIDCSQYKLLLCVVNKRVKDELEMEVLKYFRPENIYRAVDKYGSKAYTKIGKYSAGPLCKDNILIEEIGAFCSFAEGCAVHGNHGIDYITTHTMLYKGSQNTKTDCEHEWNYYKDEPWYIEGVQPKGSIKKDRRIKIGNDVWLGRNVVICNYSNIGNGVIAGAGAIITHDVPDYAVVGGVPAKIIRYRYNREQINQLNKIKWWDWEDEQIRDRFDDFYLPVDEFIKKYEVI